MSVDAVQDSDRVPSGTSVPRVIFSRAEALLVSPRNGILWTVDGADGSTLDSSVVLSLSGEIVLGATGLARHSQTGTVYALLKLLGVSTRELVTLDVETGVTTSVGNTGDKFASITFGSDGTLYGITGDGATSPQSLYSSSTTTAAATLLTSRGTPVEEVTDGEALGFNPTDGLLIEAQESVRSIRPRSSRRSIPAHSRSSTCHCQASTMKN